MIHAPHPDLRRLYAVGGVMARTAERLGAVLPELSQLMSTPAEGTLIDDAVLQSLARTPNLAALFGHELESLPQEDVPIRAKQSGAPAPELPSRKAQRTSTAAQSRSVRNALKKEVESGQLAVDLNAAAGARPGTRTREVKSGDGLRVKSAGGRTAETVIHNRSRAQRRVAQQQADADAMRRIVSSEVSERVRQTVGDTQGSVSTNRLDLKQSVRGAARIANTQRVLLDNLPRREQLVTQHAVMENLRKRAERVGAHAAADTPMSIAPVSAQVAALLELAVASGAGARRDAGLAVRVPNLAVGEGPMRGVDAAMSVPVLTRVLERISAGPIGSKRRATSSPRVVPTRAVAGLWTNPSVQDRRTSEFADPAQEEPTSGLRRLLARHDSMQHGSSTSGIKRELPHTQASGVVATRLRDAELAEALDRLLRREARRQGVDLEGLS